MGEGCWQESSFLPGEEECVCMGQEGQQNEEQLPAVSVC